MKSVYIIGLGAQSVIGRTATTTLTSVGSGFSRLTDHPVAIDRKGEPVTVSMASYLDEDLPVVERMTELALYAIEQAMSPLRGQRRPGTELMVPLVLGLPKARPGLSSSFEHEVSQSIRGRLGEGSLISSVQTIAEGHTAGSMAIQRAFEMIRDGLCPIVLAGGVDSYIDVETLQWLDQVGKLRADHNISGFFPGEGAGVCLLASEEVETILEDHHKICRLVAAATATEEQTTPVAQEKLATEDSPESADDAPPRARKGLDAAWESVLGVLPSESTISLTICDVNGQRERSDAWSSTFTQFHERFESGVSYLSPALSTGDLGAASGPIFAAMMAVGLSMMTSEESWGLVSTSTTGGPHAAALLASIAPTSAHKESS